MDMVHRISIDIDDFDVRRVLLTYVNAKKFFKDSKIEVEISSSGSGFHVIIHKDVSVMDNLMYRAVLGDDPVRIAYSLRRYAMLNEPYTVDILFVKKDGKYVKKIDIDKILSKIGVRAEDINESNFDEIAYYFEKVVKSMVGNLFYLVVYTKEPLKKIEDAIYNIYNESGIRLHRAKIFDKDKNGYYIIAKRVGNGDFSDVIKEIESKLIIEDYWIKEFEP